MIAHSVWKHIWKRFKQVMLFAYDLFYDVVFVAAHSGKRALAEVSYEC
jgi:hypothetical protein